jgi:YjbE family integral membrane protein
MESLFPPHFWVALWQIVVVDVLLSGDNAVVIALACRNLSPRYRNRAIVAGTAGAVGVRVAFCFTISWLMHVPALKLVGGALLLWIGVKLMLPEQEEEGGEGIKGEANLWGAIRTIVIADVVMSLDNVIGIVAAAKGHMVLVVFGLALSIPLIVFGSRLVLTVLNRFPALVVAGAALLGWLAGEIMTGDVLVVKLFPEVGHGAQRIAAVIGAALVVAVGTWLKRRAAAEHRPLEDLRVEEPK